MYPDPRRARWASPGPLSLLSVSGLLLLLNACGLSQTRTADRSELLLSATPPRSAACRAEPEPALLPAASAIVDSARLAAAVAGLRDADPPAAGYVLLTLAFDADGTNIRRDLIEHSTRPAVADSMQRLVFAARQQAQAAEAEWGVRLRVDLADPVALRVGRREFCPPVARDRQIEEAIHSIAPAGVRHRGLRRERIIRMRARVSEAGTITSAHVARGELRGSSLEREIAIHLRQFLFNPATLDGVPTSAWVEIPVRVRG
jgi:hypothetical protein